MKRLSILILGLLVITGFTFAQSIMVTSPHSGDTWYKSNSYNITWTKTGTMDANVKITLYDPPGTNLIHVMTMNTPNDGSYNWAIPNSILVGNYIVRVKTTDNLYFDNSDIFSITDPPGPAASITVNSPNGGETLTRGNNFSIAWTSSGVTGNVNLILWKGSANLGQIAQNQPANGSYNWHVGDALVNPPGTTYPDGNDFKVMVKSIEDWTISDESNGNFTIKITFSTMTNLEFKAVAIQSPKPDLVPGFSSSTPIENKHVFQGEILNAGEAVVEDPKIKLEISGTGGFITTTFHRTIKGTLVPGQRDRFIIEYIVPNLKENGTFMYKITADPSDDIDESNENNNRIEFSFAVTPNTDLIVCTSNNKRPGVGYKTQVHAYVKNIGYQRSGPCKLRFYIEKKGANEYDIPILDPGASHTITREVKWGLSGTKTISAIIDYYKKIREFREDNNRVVSSYFVRLPHHKKTTHEPYSICSRKAFNIPW